MRGRRGLGGSEGPRLGQQTPRLQKASNPRLTACAAYTVCISPALGLQELHLTESSGKCCQGKQHFLENLLLFSLIHQVFIECCAFFFLDTGDIQKTQDSEKVALGKRREKH